MQLFWHFKPKGIGAMCSCPVQAADILKRKQGAAWPQTRIQDGEVAFCRGTVVASP